MDESSEQPDLSHAIVRPRPVRAPSGPAQAALFIAGAVALFLFVMQLTAPNQNGLVSGHDASFGVHGPAVKPVLR